nr:hypothetical protein CFP56_18136 [Quercus suber]
MKPGQTTGATASFIAFRKRDSQPEAVFFCWNMTAMTGTATPMLKAVATARDIVSFWCFILSKLYMCLACK